MRIYTRACICTVHLSCARATEYVRGYLHVHICVSRLSIATCSPPPTFSPPRSPRSVSMSHQQSNLYAGLFWEPSRNREGGFQPSPFLLYLVVAPIGPSRTPLSTCLRRLLAKSPRLVRGSMPSTTIRSSWFCSNMADRHVLSFSFLRLCDDTISRYFPS